MVDLKFSTELTQMIGKGICDGLRSTTRNWPTYRVSSDSQDQTERGRSHRFQGEKRMCRDPCKQCSRWIVLEQNVCEQTCRTKGRNSKPRQRQGMSWPMQHRLKKFVS